MGNHFQHSFNGQDMTGRVTPPPQNQLSLIPITRMVHNLDNLNDLNEVVFIDGLVAEMVFKKYGNISSSRREIKLHLIGYGTSFDVSIWVIPLFSEGMLVHLLFAADEHNQRLLSQHRNPVKPANYDILASL